MRPAAVIAVALAATGLSACQSSQDKAAELRKQGDRALAGREGLKIDKVNKDVDVLGSTILSDKNGTAVVVEMQNKGKTDLADVPIAIRLDDAKGKKVFANDAPGLEQALVSMPLLPRGKDSYWVHNQVIPAAKPATLDVRVGEPVKPVEVPADPPHLTLSNIKLDRDADGAFLHGTVNNRSAIVQKRVTIFCVAKKGGKIVAAGRAVVEKLPPAEGLKKPIEFTVYFIGNPAGATLDFTVPPVALR
ncbi:MAG: hypothetical protein ACJ762_03265 [Solirubrobacteraceae bacterium]